MMDIDSMRSLRQRRGPRCARFWRGGVERRDPQPAGFWRGGGERGGTLLGVIIVITILLVLMGGAVAVGRVGIRGARRTGLRRGLWGVRGGVQGCEGTRG